MQKPIGADAKLHHSTRELFRAIALRCNGKTLVCERGEGHLTKIIKGHRLGSSDIGVVGLSIPESDSEGSDKTVTPLFIDELNLPEQGFNTVVLTDVLQELSREKITHVLSTLWVLIRAGGRLIVMVPNQQCLSRHDRVEHLKLSILRRLLQQFGITKLVKEQPFKWLLMYVTKGESNRPVISHSNRVRYRTTAKLCRGRVIELGCGEGHLTKVISDRGLEVTGVDINAPKIQHARELYPKINFIHCDICKLTLPEEGFDTAVLAEVLEHMPEDKGNYVLSKAWELLRPGGRLIVSVPNEGCIPHPNHVRLFSLRSLKILLQPFGKPKVVTDQPYKWLMMYVDRTS